MAKIRWGVIGTANIATFRVIPAIQKSHNGEVVAVASRDAERARDYAEQHGIAQSYGSYAALLEDPSIDAIYIPLPNKLHAEWSIQCAEAGKPTLCEKPLGSTAEEVQRMVDVFRERGVPLAEAFMYRFHPRTERVKDILSRGAVGEMHLIDAVFSFKIRRLNDVRLQPQLAGGALRDLGVYCVNLMRLMTGEEPGRVHAIGHFGADSGVEEWAVGSLQFPSGVLGSFSCGMRSYRTHGYLIRGSEGTIIVQDGFGPEHDQATEIVLYRDTGNLRETLRIEIPATDQFQRMVEDFADALLNDRSPRYPAEDAVANMKVLDRMQASMRVGEG